MTAKTRVVLFDLDGTLVKSPWESKQFVKEFREKTKAKLLELGIPFHVINGIKRSSVMRNRALDYVLKLDPKEVEKFKREMEEFLVWFESQAAERTKIYDDTIETLRSIKESGYKCGLVTNQSRIAANMILSTWKLKGYFKVIITRNDVERVKPDPEGILLALKRLKEKQFYMVGDSMIDVKAAIEGHGVPIYLRRTHSVNKVATKKALVISSLNELSPSLLYKVLN